MPVKPLDNVNQRIIISKNTPHKNSINTMPSAQKKEYSNISAENIKANFVPSFGRYWRMNDVPIIDQDNGKTISAQILRQRKRWGNIYNYVLAVNNDYEGFMNIDSKAIFPEFDDLLLTDFDNNIPQITYMFTKYGNKDKYKGIGSNLIRQAIFLSQSLGKNGSLWLNSQILYDSSIPSYKKILNPLPFYYKVGFRSPFEDIDNSIKTIMEEEDYTKLPDEALLILSPQDANYFLRRCKILYRFN